VNDVTYLTAIDVLLDVRTGPQPEPLCFSQLFAFLFNFVDHQPSRASRTQRERGSLSVGVRPPREGHHRASGRFLGGMSGHVAPESPCTQHPSEGHRPSTAGA
jgi:hypothetical protein